MHPPSMREPSTPAQPEAIDADAEVAQINSADAPAEEDGSSLSSFFSRFSDGSLSSPRYPLDQTTPPLSVMMAITVNLMNLHGPLHNDRSVIATLPLLSRALMLAMLPILRHVTELMPWIHQHQPTTNPKY